MNTIKKTDRGVAPQVRIKLPVTLLVGDDDDVSVTEEVGFGGVFLRTEKPYVLRQLVQLSIALPDGQSLSSRGMIVRIVDDESAEKLVTVPGIAVQFYALEENEASIWTAFVNGQIKTSRPSHIDRDASSPLAARDRQPENVKRVSGPPGHNSAIDDDEPQMSVEELARAAGLDPQIVMSAIESKEVDRDSSVGGLSRPIHIIGPDVCRSEGALASKLLSGASIHEKEVGDSPVEARRIAEMPDATSTAVGYRVLDDIEESDGQGLTKSLESIGCSVADSPSRPKLEGDEAPTQGDSSSPSESCDDLDSRPTLPLTDSDRLRRGRPHRDPVRLRQRELPPSPNAPRVEDSSLPSSPFEKNHPVGGAKSQSSSAAPLAPTGSLPNVVYRLELPTVSALEEFSHVAFGSGGVSVRTPSIRPAGTPAVVCVVHPVSRHEFHIPGSIVATRADRPGVSIRFARVTAKTFRDFRRFIAIGRRRAGRLAYQSSTGGELTMVRESSGAHKSLPQGSSPKDTHPVGLEAVEPLRKGRPRE